MPGEASQTNRAANPAQRLLDKVGERLRRLSLSVFFWDAAGEPLTSPVPPSEFCRLMQQRGVCHATLAQLAQQACAEGRAQVGACPPGCCVLAVPVHQRRRLAGAAVACLPTLQTPDSEDFARACGQARLDRELTARLCRQAARHSASEGEALCQVVEWLIQDEQAKDVAREELANLSANLASTYEELSLLYRISGSMKVSQSGTEFFRNLCGELLEVMQLQWAAAVLYPREHAASQAAQIVSAGQSPLTDEQLALVARRYLAPRLSASAKPLIDNQFSLHAAHLGARVSQIRCLIAVPLLCAESARGVLLGVNKLRGEFDSVDLKLISSVGGQAAVFLENHHLYEGLQDLLMGVLHALTASIDAKDPYTCGHSQRVAMISRKLAGLCSFDARRVERVYLAGLLHDVGKIGMPEAVLRKNGRLTDDEYDSVKRHPEVGARILGGIRQMEDVIPAILHHHERVDGKGYPGRLNGHEIPIEALIVGLADSFDAMTSCRTYRAGMPPEAALAEVRRCSGTQFDSRLCELFLTLDLEPFLAELRQAGGEAQGDKA